MKRYSRELIIGASVLVALMVLFFGIDYLKGINVFKASNYYYVSYTNVTGLSGSSPVLLNGYKVGQVREIQYEYDNPGHVLVELALDKQLRVPNGSKAVLSAGLLGDAQIDLKFSTSKDFHTLGDKLIGETSSGLMDNVARIMPGVDSIFAKVDSLLTSVNRLAGDPALLASVQRLDKITANLEASTSQLNQTLKTMPSVMSNVKNIAQNIDSLSSDLTVVSKELKGMPMKETVENINVITDNVKLMSEKLNKDDNSLGLLLNDRQLYDNINGTVGSLDSLLIDVKKNPKRYISIKLL